MFGWNYDFINIDTEGESVPLALVLPLDRCEQLKMICVEHDGNIQRLNDHLGAWGFKELSSNPENLLLVR